MGEKRVIQKIAFLLYLIAMGYLCFGHFDNMPEVEKTILGIRWDRWVHFLMFLPFPFLLYESFNWPVRIRRHSFLLTAGILAAGCIIAFGTEFIQGLTSYRAYDIHDFYADGAALLISSAIVLALELNRTRNYEQ